MADYVYASSTSSSGTPIVSLAEARRHLNMSTTEDDPWISAAVETATHFVEQYTGRAYLNQRRRLQMQTFADARYVRNRKIYPEKTPILGSSYVTITYVDSAGTTQTLATSDYIVSYRDNPSCISEAYSATWPDTRNYENDVTVTYTVGTTATPVTVKHAVNMLVGHWYNNREAMSDKSMQDVPLGFLALMAPEMIERYG